MNTGTAGSSATCTARTHSAEPTCVCSAAAVRPLNGGASDFWSRRSGEGALVRVTASCVSNTLSHPAKQKRNETKPTSENPLPQNHHRQHTAHPHTPRRAQHAPHPTRPKTVTKPDKGRDGAEERDDERGREDAVREAPPEDGFREGLVELRGGRDRRRGAAPEGGRYCPDGRREGGHGRVEGEVFGGVVFPSITATPYFFQVL